MEGRAERLAASAWLIFKRSLANWRSLLPLVAGLVLASAIMAATTIYYDALNNLAFSRALVQHAPEDLDILAVHSQRPTSYGLYRRIADSVEWQVERRLSWLLDGSTHAVKSETMALSASGAEASAGADDRRAYFAVAPRLYDHVTVLPGGSRPRPPRLQGPGEPMEIEAIVPADVADELDIEAGQVLSAVPYSDSAVPFARVTVSGLFERRAAGDDFWVLYDRVLQKGASLTVESLPLFVDEGGYFAVVGPAFGRLESTYGWLLDVDTDLITVADKERAAADIEQAQQWINSAEPGFRLSTSLLAVFTGYDERLLFTKVPMLVFLVTAAIVVLYYVATMASLTIDRRRTDIVLLRARGADSRGVLAIFLIEGAGIVAFAVALGPLVAVGAVNILGLTPALSDVSGGAVLGANVSIGSYLLSAVGGVLGFGAILLASLQACRTDVSEHRQRQARPPELPLFQRRYLDVMLLVIAVVLFWQLAEQGSVLAEGLFGEAAVNNVLLAAPGLALVAASMVLLRLFPLAMRLLGGLLSRYSPASLMLGVWHIGRNPTPYSRVFLLLVLMAGLGVAAASFVATLERNFVERVLYGTGGDIRVEGIGLDIGIPRRDIASAYEKDDGVARAAPVYRGRASDVNFPRRGTLTLLAIDMDSFGDVAWLPQGFPADTVEDVLKSSRRSAPVGLPLSETASTLNVRFKAERPDPSLRLTFRIRDANDRYHSYTAGPLGRSDFLGNVKKPEWLLGSTSFHGPGRWWQVPLALVSMGVHAEYHFDPLPRGSILIDHISEGRFDAVRSGQGYKELRVETEVVDHFDSPEEWTVMRLNPESGSDVLSGAGDVRFSWGGGGAVTSHGIMFGPGLSPMSVLGSASLVESGDYRIGDNISLSVASRTIPATLAGTVELFPTLDPRSERFVVADLKTLVRYANLDPLADELQANEVWLSLEPAPEDSGPPPERFYERPFDAELVHNRARLLAESDVDPLARAGWRALLVGAFSTVLLLASIGFFVHVYFSFREREQQFAVLRSIGLSTRQLAAIVWLEQAVQVLGGMALGAWMGVRLVSAVMPFMGHDETGGRVVPPFAVQVDWLSLALAYAVITVIFGGIMGGVVWAIHRVAAHRALRIEDI